MRRAFLPIATLAVCACAHAATFDDEHPRDRDRFAAFRLWVPDDVLIARVLVVLVPGFNTDGRAQVDDTAWQKFAKDHRGALLGCFFQGHESGTYQWQSLWSGVAFEKSLARLSEKSQHAEVATVPIVMWGHSAGGQFTYNFACWKPQRLLAFGVCKGGHNFLETQPATLQIPGVFIAGARATRERVVHLTNLFTEGRRRGAPWCLVVEPRGGHETGRGAEVGRALFDSVLRQSSAGPAPGTSWEGDLTTHQIRQSPPVGKPGAITSWLPDEVTARLWQELIDPKPAQTTPINRAD